MPKWQRLTLGVLALFAWGILGTVSILANMKFAKSLGTSEMEQYLLQFAGVASDLFKAAAPAALLVFVARRQSLAAALTAVLGTIVTVFSIMAAYGFLSTERLANYDRLSAAKQDTVALQKSIGRLEQDRDWVPSHKPLPVLEAELAAKRADPIWSQSAYCTRIQGPAQDGLCRSLRELDVAIAAAKAAAAQDAMLALQRKELREKGRSFGDAQVESLAWLAGSERGWLIFVIILGVALIELGSMFGLTIALALLMGDASTTLGRFLGQAVATIRPKAPTPDQVETAIRQQRQDQARLRDKVPKAAVNFPKPVAGPAGGRLRDLLEPMPRKRRRQVA